MTDIEYLRERAYTRRQFLRVTAAAGTAVATGSAEAWFEALPELAERAIGVVSPELSMTVLDVGAGPGTFALRVAPRVARVVAIDFADR